MQSPVRVLVLCGATASGKSEIAVMVAQAIGGEIVNADSRQVYAGLPIGTGWPEPQLMGAVPHHLYGFVDPCSRYSAGAFVRDARHAIADIARRGRIPIIVGGTGFYVEALAGTMKLDRAVGDEATRARVRREALVHSQHFLWEWLALLDRRIAQGVPSGDRYRTLRALESVLSTGDARAGAPDLRNPAPDGLTLECAVVVLAVPRDELAERIARRVRGMFDAGLAREAVALHGRCPHAPALTGLGFSESLTWQRGEATRDEAIRCAIARTRRYAKRQDTWFRRMRNAMRVDGRQREEAARAIASMAREIAAAT